MQRADKRFKRIMEIVKIVTPKVVAASRGHLQKVVVYDRLQL